MPPPAAAIAVVAVLAMVAAAAPAAAAGDEDCIFDQAAQVAHYREMERRIEGARYDAADGALVIARGAATITVRRGGCVHFGLTITSVTPVAGAAERDDVFARAVALVAEFGGGELVTADAVAAAIREDAFELADGQVYYLRVPGVEALSIAWRIADGRLTVEVAYYIN